MKISTVAGSQTYETEPPRSTAYYYGDLERIKRQNGSYPQNGGHPQNGRHEIQEVRQNIELNEYVTANEVVNDGAVREVPPLRDRQWSLPEYSTPEGQKETYSTAGTFPMPEPKEKEPLLSELEVVGRLPLSQLDAGVRRSRSWYLCCPNVGEEEISRESSWRYSSLRPVTSPPAPNQNGLTSATQSSVHTEDPATLRAERDALARALAAERQRASVAARAQDARLAELHGVIAELVRRQRDKHSQAIPEEELSDECESTTQPAGELDKDTDQSQTDQNESCSLSPEVTPEEKALPTDLDVTTDTSTQADDHVEYPAVAASSSLHLSDKDSQLCLSSARRCQSARGAGSSPASRRDTHVYSSPGRCEARQAKLASRVRLTRTEDGDLSSGDETWCIDTVERLAKDVCAQAEFREELAAAGNDGSALCRLAARCAALTAALARAEHNQTRLQRALALQESSCVCVCAALGAADRALECYDVLLALAEAKEDSDREEAERIASQLLCALDAPRIALPTSLLPPGPWRDTLGPASRWSPASELRLRSHAARLKAASVNTRHQQPPPALYSQRDTDDEDGGSLSNKLAVEMEEAVELEALLLAKDSAGMLAAARGPPGTRSHKKTDSQRSRARRRRENPQFDKHWLHAANETQL